MGPLGVGGLNGAGGLNIANLLSAFGMVPSGTLLAGDAAAADAAGDSGGGAGAGAGPPGCLDTTGMSNVERLQLLESWDPLHEKAGNS